MLKRSRIRPSSGRNKHVVSKLILVDSQDNRPKIGNAQQLYDKYTSLARGAITTGDHILAESYYQRAEHYLRHINEHRTHTEGDELEERKLKESEMVGVSSAQLTSNETEEDETLI